MFSKIKTQIFATSSEFEVVLATTDKIIVLKFCIYALQLRI